jgi:hypothetical protein
MQRIIILLLFCFLQVWIAGKIALWGYATPLLYLYPILKLPAHTSRNSLLLYAFGVGSMIDFFSNTPGMYACASTLFALLRPFILHTVTSSILEADKTDFVPSTLTLRPGGFLVYTILSVLLTGICLFALQTFIGGSIEMLFLRAAASIGLTVIVLFLIDLMRNHGHK